MTYKVIKIHVEKSCSRSKVGYVASFNGDGRYFYRVFIQLKGNAANASISSVELYALGLFLYDRELAGQNRKSKNLTLILSDRYTADAILGASEDRDLAYAALSCRVRLFGLEDIAVEQYPEWTRGLDINEDITWNGRFQDLPVSINPVIGPVAITLHALNRYLKRTDAGCRRDLVFSHVAKLVRLADVNVILDDKVRIGKFLTYLDDFQYTQIIKPKNSSWNLVILSKPGEVSKLVTIYQRNEHWYAHPPAKH